MPPKLLSVTETAAHLGVTRRRVLTLIEEKRLPATRVGRQWTIRANDLERYQPQAQGRPRKGAEAGGGGAE